MSTLQGNLKKIIRAAAMKPDSADSESCPKSEVPKDFHGKTYSEEQDFKPSPGFCSGLKEEQKLEHLLRMKHNLTDYFDNTAYHHPYGMTAHDYKILNPEAKECLENLKMNTRREDYIYLNEHPEIDAMMELVLRKLMTELPCDPIKYMAEFFCLKQSSYEEHKEAIEKERQRIILYRKSKSKEFYISKSDPLATIRKLNLGPLADILVFSDPVPEGSETKEPRKSCRCPSGECPKDADGADICPEDTLAVEDEEEIEGEFEIFDEGFDPLTMGNNGFDFSRFSSEFPGEYLEADVEYDEDGNAIRMSSGPFMELVPPEEYQDQDPASLV